MDLGVPFFVISIILFESQSSGLGRQLDTPEHLTLTLGEYF